MKLLQNILTLFNINRGWLNRLIGMSSVILITSIPFVILLVVGIKPSYSVYQFIFPNSYLSGIILLISVITTGIASYLLNKPTSVSGFKTMLKNTQRYPQHGFVDNFIGFVTEEILCRLIPFYTITTILTFFKLPEIFSVLIFVLISANYFAKLHIQSGSFHYYVFYFLSGIFLGLLFPLVGLMGTIVVHATYNTVTDLSVAHYLSHPPKF